MGRVVVLGSLNVDLVTRVERHARPGETVRGEGLRRLAGGKGGNQAVAAAAAGAEVAFVGAVGADAAGSAYLDRLRDRGIDVSGVEVVDGPSGHAFIGVDSEGENAIVAIPGANAHVGARALRALDGLRAGDVLLLQLEVPLPTVTEAVRRGVDRGARVVLNIAPYAALPAEVVALADPLVANEHEAALLAGSAAAPGSLLVTRGAHGASWDAIAAPVEQVAAADVVDTTGAGDAFCGALAAALARGAGRAEALGVASRAGAAAVRHEGAQADGDLA